MPVNYDDIKKPFTDRFGSGGRIHVVRAPGRVNLIGEHTDYNDGFVFPMAIEPQVLIVCRGREDGMIRLASTQFPSDPIAEFSVQKKIERGQPKWTNYCRGVAAFLIAAGIPLTGMDALITNTLPVGGGLSSSAALEVATAVSLFTLTGTSMDPSRLALLCQKVEHEFADTPSGIMDQTIVISGKAGHAMLLDCRDYSKQFFAIDSKEVVIAVANSMVKHELSDGEYGKRRKQCEAGVAYFQQENPRVRALRDVTMPQIDAAKGKLDDLIWRRCKHVVGENARATTFAQKLDSRHYEEAGELAIASHNSLRDDYEVSCPELDFLVESAMKVKGVYGARMTGGGFGGCIIALLQPRSVETFKTQVAAAYQEKFNKIPTIFVTSATAGANAVE